MEKQFLLELNLFKIKLRFIIIDFIHADTGPVHQLLKIQIRFGPDLPLCATYELFLLKKPNTTEIVICLKKRNNRIVTSLDIRNKKYLGVS